MYLFFVIGGYAIDIGQNGGDENFFYDEAFIDTSSITSEAHRFYLHG
jgi:hypothetical protein